MVSQPVCLGVKPHLRYNNRYLFLSDSNVFADVGRPLWREKGSVVYNFCCSSPAQLFSDPGPARLMTIFYCLRIETPPTWRARSPYLYPPRKRVAHLYLQAPGFLFVASYDTQGYGGRTRTRPHTGWLLLPFSQSQSQSYFTTGGLPPISSSWRQAPWGSQPDILFYFLQLNPCGCSSYVTTSLTSGWAWHRLRPCRMYV
jgi:hypothetical protein